MGSWLVGHANPLRNCFLFQTKHWSGFDFSYYFTILRMCDGTLHKIWLLKMRVLLSFIKLSGGENWHWTQISWKRLQVMLQGHWWNHWWFENKMNAPHVIVCWTRCKQSGQGTEKKTDQKMWTLDMDSRCCPPSSNSSIWRLWLFNISQQWYASSC